MSNFHFITDNFPKCFRNWTCFIMFKSANRCIALTGVYRLQPQKKDGCGSGSSFHPKRKDDGGERVLLLMGGMGVPLLMGGMEVPLLMGGEWRSLPMEGEWMSVMGGEWRSLLMGMPVLMGCKWKPLLMRSNGMPPLMRDEGGA